MHVMYMKLKKLEIFKLILSLLLNTCSRKIYNDNMNEYPFLLKQGKNIKICSLYSLNLYIILY